MPLDLTDQNVSDVINQVELGLTEPLGHELYREAWNQRAQNPRSALVIGYAAAEVGFKHCVAFLIPAAAWLVENSPSPPLDLILDKYFPTLSVRLKMNGRDPVTPKQIIREVREAKRLSKTVHTKGEDLNIDVLNAILWAVQDLLWLFDYHCGHEWALNNIRPEIRDKLIKTV